MTRSLDTVTILLVVPSPASVFRRVSVAFGGLWPAINLSSDSVTVTFMPCALATACTACQHSLFCKAWDGNLLLLQQVLRLLQLHNVSLS